MGDSPGADVERSTNGGGCLLSVLWLVVCGIAVGTLAANKDYVAAALVGLVVFPAILITAVVGNIIRGASQARWEYRTGQVAKGECLGCPRAPRCVTCPRAGI